MARRFDAKDRNARGDEMLQKVAVVRRDLDHLRLRTKTEPCRHGRGIAARVVNPTRGPG